MYCCLYFVVALAECRATTYIWSVFTVTAHRIRKFFCKDSKNNSIFTYLCCAHKTFLPSSNSPNHKNCSHRKSKNIANVQPLRSHIQHKSTQIPNRKIKQPIRHEGDRDNSLHILHTSEHPHSNTLYTIGDLVDANINQQHRGDLNNLCIRQK